MYPIWDSTELCYEVKTHKKVPKEYDIYINQVCDGNRLKKKIETVLKFAFLIHIFLNSCLYNLNFILCLCVN